MGGIPSVPRADEANASGRMRRVRGYTDLAYLGIVLGRSRLLSASPRRHRGQWERESSTVLFNWNAFQFSPGTMPGFRDYQSAYTHFRILYARLTISTFDPQGSTSNETLNYLVAGSRPFAASNAPVNESTAANNYVPPQLEQDLRQTKWQKVHYPSKVANKIVTSFHPYTMVATHGPVTNTSSTTVYQRIWEGRTWMPITWTLNSPLIFYGPYVVASTMQGKDPDPSSSSTSFPAYGNLEVLCQFRGQK